MTQTKRKLLQAAETQFLIKGYAATTVDEICSMAGATKGAFFHHFRSKQEVALRALEQHSERRFGSLRRSANDHVLPRDRVLAYVDRLGGMTDGIDQPTCLVASMALELSEVDPAFRSACAQAYERWTDDLIALLQPAFHDPDSRRSREVAHVIMASFQGALVVARAKRQPAVISHAMQAARAHLVQLLDETASRRLSVASN